MGRRIGGEWKGGEGKSEGKGHCMHITWERVQRRPHPASAGWSRTANTLFSTSAKSMSAVE